MPSSPRAEGVLMRQLADQLAYSAGTVVALAICTVLALSAWAACLVGAVVLLEPYWGLALSLLFVAGVLTVGVIAGVLVLRHRAQTARIRSAVAADVARRQMRAELLARLPVLLRKRSGLMIIASGVALGAMIVASLEDAAQASHEDRPPQ